ncbi:MAG TPA: hypothetical protein VH701_05865 [Vicinamibacterales bacterium]|jgi:hypothetical protein
MGWIVHRKGTLTYSGRLSCPPSFVHWTETDGRAAVTEVASKRWFSILGKRRAARRAIWRELQQLAESGSLANEIHNDVAAYTSRMVEFALERTTLPRVSVDLRRMYVVPRATYNAWTYNFFTQRLASRREVAALKGGPEFLKYFCFELLSAADKALVESAPSVHHPLRAGMTWSIVGADSKLVWSVPFGREPDWRGHYYLCEMPADSLTRARRKQLATGVKTLEDGVSELSRLRKSAILAERPIWT